MFIKSISSELPIRMGKTIKRITNYGKYKNYHIAIETDYKDNKIISKQFIIWNDIMQKIVNKFKNEQGKFNRIG